jgi:hypothetical protein
MGGAGVNHKILPGLNPYLYFIIRINQGDRALYIPRGTPKLEYYVAPRRQLPGGLPNRDIGI